MASRRDFQSPFHRGNGCYTDGYDTILECYFQSAFHRGNGCYYKFRCMTDSTMAAFSPLFIAAMVATCIPTAQ